MDWRDWNDGVESIGRRAVKRIEMRLISTLDLGVVCKLTLPMGVLLGSGHFKLRCIATAGLAGLGRGVVYVLVSRRLYNFNFHRSRAINVCNSLFMMTCYQRMDMTSRSSMCESKQRKNPMYMTGQAVSLLPMCCPQGKSLKPAISTSRRELD